VRGGVLLRNPVNVAERLVVAGSAVVDDVLSADDASRLLTAARGDRLEALGAVLLGTGPRKGEALALRWSDVDLTAATIRVERTLQRLGGQLVIGPPKDPVVSANRRSPGLRSGCAGTARGATARGEGGIGSGLGGR
jgi:integrase